MLCAPWESICPPCAVLRLRLHVARSAARAARACAISTAPPNRAQNDSASSRPRCECDVALPNPNGCVNRATPRKRQRESRQSPQRAKTTRPHNSYAATSPKSVGNAVYVYCVNPARTFLEPISNRLRIVCVEAIPTVAAAFT